MIDLEDHAGRQALDIAQVKEEGFPAVSQVEVQGRVPEGIVDETGIEHGMPVRGFGRLAGIPFPATTPSTPVVETFYYGSACVVKATREKSLDFKEEKRFDSQLDDLLQPTGR
jgi:hypothetical protein